VVRRTKDLPGWLPRSDLERFLHDQMVPWEDRLSDISRGLDYAFSEQPGCGGLVLLATGDRQLYGAVVILHTGMSGFVPEHLMLFVSVRKDCRGAGLGSRLVLEALSHCPGDVKLHVEYGNPAKRLYERLGFTSPYAEMRFSR